MELDVETFIAVKGYKAIGKRVTTLHIGKVEELEPLRTPSNSPVEGEKSDDSDYSESSDNQEYSSTSDNSSEDSDTSEGKSQDEMNGQLSFDF